MIEGISPKEFIIKLSWLNPWGTPWRHDDIIFWLETSPKANRIQAGFILCPISKWINISG